MQQQTLNELAEQIFNKLTEGRRGFYESGVWLELLRLLAQGKPVSTSQIANSLHLAVDKVGEILNQSPDMEFDTRGNIVGMGLSLNPTPHRFQVNGHQLYTWCALDSLMYPVALEQTAQVKSTCPVTGDEVRATVTLEGVSELFPATSAVSIFIPENSQTCCRSTFCNEGKFFTSAEAASVWLGNRPSGLALSVAEAFHVGAIVSSKRKVAV
jgi:alkylmercury lyase